MNPTELVFTLVLFLAPIEGAPAVPPVPMHVSAGQSEEVTAEDFCESALARMGGYPYHKESYCFPGALTLDDLALRFPGVIFGKPIGRIGVPGGIRG